MEICEDRIVGIIRTCRTESEEMMHQHRILFLSADILHDE